jgi:DNA polymerase III subunit chi
LSPTTTSSAEEAATDVWFYHLQSQPLARALPAILGKAMERGWRVAIQTVDDLRLKALDDLLWTFDKTSFLPHATARDANPAAQPILLTTDGGNPNAADMRVFVEGAEVALDAEQDAYKRVILMFDGTNEAELEAARSQWSRLKRDGHALEYWQQGESGGWKRTA